jgi:hypothetical protein
VGVDAVAVGVGEPIGWCALGVPDVQPATRIRNAPAVQNHDQAVDQRRKEMPRCRMKWSFPPAAHEGERRPLHIAPPRRVAAGLHSRGRSAPSAFSTSTDAPRRAAGQRTEPTEPRRWRQRTPRPLFAMLKATIDLTHPQDALVLTRWPPLSHSVETDWPERRASMSDETQRPTTATTTETGQNRPDRPRAVTGAAGRVAGGVRGQRGSGQGAV